MTGISNDQLFQLHTALYARFQKYNVNLQAMTCHESAAGEGRSATPVMTYLRKLNEAQTVEGMMGRDFPIRKIDLRRHPVIELRAFEDGIALELIVAPDAWCDQQNLTGKLSIDRNKHTFQQMISRLSDDYRLGFWQGTHLDAMHLTPRQAAHPAVFPTWIATFCGGQDWFRTGVWYSSVPENVSELNDELFRQALVLYDFYNFIAWTSNNDYRSFQGRGERVAVYA